MVDTRTDYHADAVAAARTVMLELVRLHGLVAEGLRKIREKFLSSDHIGPRSVADFEENTDQGERDLRQRDAFERVRYLLKQLEIA
jgi:hypothetical protein